MPTHAHPPGAELEVLTGQEVARAAAEDFRSFYTDDSPLTVNVSIENCHIAAFRTSGEVSRIVISPDMAHAQIETADDLFFHLLIICHEIAHLVHKHERVNDEAIEDEANVEFWADFYSGRALITILTYGAQIKPILQRFFPFKPIPGQFALAEPDIRPTLPFHVVLDSIGLAVDKLVSKVYVDSNRYPPKVLRAGLICNGVTSALRHELISPDPIWYFSVIKRVLLSSESISSLAKRRPMDVVVDRAQIERVRAIHRNIQGSGSQITTGLKPRFANHLHTRFTHSNEEIAQMERERKADVQAMFDKYPNGPKIGLDDL